MWVEISMFQQDFNKQIHEENCRTCYWNAQLDLSETLYSYTGIKAKVKIELSSCFFVFVVVQDVVVI